MIIFEKIRYKNLLSTGNIFTEITLNEANTTLVIGENGAGKSTLLEALSFVLFGKPFRNINKPQLVNSITQKNLVTEVEFSIGSIKYKIVRGIKPNIFEVYQNNKLLNQSAETKDYQEILEKQILKVNHKSFCQVVILGSATFQPFMQLPAFRRREIIEDLLDLQIFSTMNILLKNDVSLNTENIAECNSNKKLVEQKIKLIKEHLIEIQNNTQQIIEEKKSLIIESNDTISSLNDKYWEMNNKLKEFEENIEDELSISKKLNKLLSLRHQIEAKKAVIEKDIIFFKKHENCPTCTQAISEQFRKNTIDNKTIEVEKIDVGLIQLIEQYEAVNSRLNEIINIHSEINSNKMDIHKIKTKIQSLVEYRDNLKKDISNIQIKDLNNEDNRIGDFESELKDIEYSYNSLIEEKNTLSAASTLLKDNGIKSKIIKQYVPIINKLINKYLSTMEFMCQFELNEEFKETIKSRYRDEFSYESFSEGEKMRINLAILFTWRAIAKMRNSINTNLLIMDEVFDGSLDSNGTEEFLKTLKNLTSDTNTFIISHKGNQFFDKFDRTLVFKKHKNFSKIV
jgi:DNA repair exonuclease SbcCD ATPase subunit